MKILKNTNYRLTICKLFTPLLMKIKSEPISYRYLNWTPDPVF